MWPTARSSKRRSSNSSNNAVDEVLAALEKESLKGGVTPHWFADNTRFWYVNNLRDGAREFILVDAVAGKREKAFDHEKLAAGSRKLSIRPIAPIICLLRQSNLSMMARQFASPSMALAGNATCRITK